MMPDLGAYGVYVLTAYGVTLGCIVALCLATRHRARKVRAELEAVEARAREQR